MGRYNDNVILREFYSCHVTGYTIKSHLIKRTIRQPLTHFDYKSFHEQVI